jgi:intein/homing endonuclease
LICIAIICVNRSELMAKYYGNIKVEKNMVNLYSRGLKLQEIADNYGGISVTTVYKILKKTNIRFKHRYEYKNSWKFQIKDVNFFNIIDTEEKAYFLGFLYADGSVHSNCNRVSLKLQKRDKEILEKLSQLIYHNYDIREDRKSVELTFYNEKMVNDIKKLGCIPNKSLILKFPTLKQVPSNFVRHFIRGYFDGDGSIGSFISKRKKNRVNFANFCGTRQFCERLLELLKLFNPNINARIDDKSNDKICVLRFSRNNVLRLYPYLYENATLFLNRKHLKFCEEVNFFVNNIKRRKNNSDVYNLLVEKIMPVNNFGP